MHLLSHLLSLSYRKDIKLATKKSQAHTRYKNAEGVGVAGVTTILNILNKPALIPWANKLGLEGIQVGKYVDDKADIGTLAHNMIHCHLTKEECDTSEYSKKQIEQAENCIISFHDWEKANNIEPLILERQLVSEDYQYGGTIDIYVRMGEHLVLIDLKTGKAIYDNMAYQLAAYNELLIENDHHVDYSMILNIPRAENENFAVRRWDNLDKEFRIFTNCLEIYNLQKEIKGS